METRLKTFVEFMYEMGFTYSDFDRPEELDNLIEMYADYVLKFHND